MSKKGIVAAEYLLLFLCFIAMYFFVVPDSDVIFFSRDYENSFTSIFSSAVNYGNGRYLGNILGFFSAFYFSWSFSFIALVLTLITVFVNKLFFNGDYRTVLPVAFLVAFPSTGMFSDVYNQVPTFINYVFPLLIVFAALCLIKDYENLRIGRLPGSLLAFFMALISCLFCENNTISIIVLSLIILFLSYSEYGKVNSVRIAFAAGAAVGSAVMFLLPRITGVSHKLDYYRGTANSLSSAVTLAVASFSTFAEIFSEFTLLIITASVCLIFLVVKNKNCRCRYKKPVLLYLAFFPAECIFYSVYSDSAPASVYLYLVQAGLVILYGLSFLAGALCLKKTAFRTKFVSLLVLMLSTVGPMIFVDKYSYRTFYLSFAAFLSLTLVTVGEVVKNVPVTKFKKYITDKRERATAGILCAVFACLTVTVFIQTVYNYNFFVVRTGYISSQIAEGAEIVTVPEMPCRAVSNEDENPSLIESMTYKTDVNFEYEIAESISCKNAADYYRILSTDPVTNLLFALKNLKYKDAGYIYELMDRPVG